MLSFSVYFKHNQNFCEFKKLRHLFKKNYVCDKMGTICLKTRQFWWFWAVKTPLKESLVLKGDAVSETIVTVLEFQ